ncbi:MAG: TIGR03564 family F420-dependent LLM class oxidoreductase [Pseudomonadales bacterium]
MNIGWNGTGIVQSASIARVAEDIAQAAERGFSSYWLADHPTGGFDALTALAVARPADTDIELGTAIVPTFPRHPMALASQSLTTAQALDGRLTLGIGLSHASMMAELGIPFEKPIRHLREYLSILVPLLEHGEVDFKGELLSCQAKVFKPDGGRCQVLVAALGPQALRVAGRMASGTTLAWVGPKTIAEHIVPTISEAAAKHDRPAPRIMATLPVCVSDTPDVVRQVIDKNLRMYGQLPSYRAMFDREGAAGPGDVALVGSADEVRDAVAQLQEAGVTDFCPTQFALSPEEKTATARLLDQMAAAAAA